MTEPLPRAERTPHPRRIQLALGVVLLLLAVLVVIPPVVHLRTLDSRKALRETVEPARSAVTELHVSLANAGSLLSDYLNTGDPVLRVRMDRTLEAAEATELRLEALTRKLGPAVSDQQAELVRHTERWRSSLGRLVAMNPVPPEELTEQQDRYEDLLLAAARLDQMVTAEGVRQRELIERAERGQLLASLILGPIALSAGLLVAWLANRLHLYAAETARSRTEIQRLMESKARLIRGFSHDVKNPLGAAQGYGELLEDGVMGPLTVPQRKAVASSQRLIHSALRIIDDLVELSRAEAGHLELKPEWLDPRSVLADAADAFAGACAARGFSLEVATPAGLPRVHADRIRLEQIVGNLLSNATKYTEAGGITLSAAYARGASGADGVAFCVRDTGPGIPEGQWEVIFAEFTRLDASATEGAGLGLAVSRRLARLMGGDLTVSSQLGLGSTFALWLPLERGRAD